MKRLLLFIWMMISLNINSSGNVISPMAYITEFYIDSSGKWMLELGFPGYTGYFIDSIYFEAFSGTSKIKGEYNFYEDSSYYVVITADSLVTPLEINPDSDHIRIITYCGYPETDHLHLGKCSRIPFIPEGHSVAIIGGYSTNGAGYEEFSLFSLDKTPTLGAGNSKEGMEGTVTGFLYDADHNPIPHRDVLGYAGYVETDANGYYSEKTLSMTYVFDTTTEFREWDTYVYEPAEIFVLPDSTFILDLVVLDMWRYTGITEIPEDAPDITNFPNPFTHVTYFYISIPKVFRYVTASLEILDHTGRIIASVPVTGQKCEITLPGDAEVTFPPGTYWYFLKTDGNIATEPRSFVKL